MVNNRKRLVSVGSTEVTVTLTDGTQHQLVFLGYYIGPHPFGGDLVRTSSDLFAAWRERSGREGMVDVGNDKYVPLCNVESIDAVHDGHSVEKD